MNLDKSWTKITNNFDPRFINGTLAFAETGKSYVDSEGNIHCPCKQRVNSRKDVPLVYARHIIHNGFDPTYDIWLYHGEHLPGYELDASDSECEQTESEADDSEIELLDDAFPTGGENISENKIREDVDQHDNPNVEKLFVDMEKPLYPECNEFSVLGFLLELMNVKVTCKMTNVAMDMILNLFSRAFKDANLPKNHYQVKKYLRTLGLGYQSTHACKYDCALFWDENKNLENCPVCKNSRYEEKSNGKKKPVKVLRYFPITSRLKRLYASRHTCKDMSWHHQKRSKEEGVLRHPADGKAWKHFDTLFPEFANDPRNVHLGLAGDGFNPFGAMSLSYSMWPIVLIPYNMPPWNSMADASFMLTLLIPGRNSPGKDIDVFLRPLIDELKLLWDKGVKTYDFESKQTFKMRAALLWTINDFPAYGYLLGWTTSGYKACPVCNDDGCGVGIRDKIAYVGHRRFLPTNHSWRRSRDFNGKTETRLAPKPISGDDCLRQLELINIHQNGKHPHIGKKRKRNAEDPNWSKKSIFFKLPYWRKLLIRHNIDVMHVEKNVCDNVLGTLLDIDGKTKDTYKARMDLEDMNIRKELHLVRNNDRLLKPHASYVLTREERKQFCDLVKSVCFPDGFAGNKEKNVNADQGNIHGLKTHDCHILLQRIIPIAIQPFMTKQTRDALLELCRFFKKLTEVTLYVSELEALQKEIVNILCKLERIFPPSFFTIMVHLCVHLPQEAIFGGPVQSRWMYPIERYLGHLKKYVRNKAKPEGSIAEGYVVEEAMTFCSQYLRSVESKFDKRGKNDDKTHNDGQSFALDIFRLNGRGVGKKEVRVLPADLLKKAIWFVYNNCEEIKPYLEEHLHSLQSQHPQMSDFSEMQRATFPDWFAKRANEMYTLDPSQTNEELYAVSCLPDHRVSFYKGYIVNGVKYIVKSTDDCRRTQNCGVTVQGVHNDVEDDYYGYIDEVIELSFIKDCHVILFKCTWFDNNRQRKHVVYEPHFISIDTSRHAYEEDPFILANQAKQVFYINDSLKPKSQWKVIERINHRHLWDIPEENNAEDLLEDVNLVRQDIAGETVQNVDAGRSEDTVNDFINDEIEDSDHDMEDFGSDSNLDDLNNNEIGNNISNLVTESDESDGND